jgi:2-oxoglutarate ferredoxin oxidoreductase subunit alpha
LLLVGWGGNQGAIEEAVDRLRAKGHAVASLHLRFIQPLPSGIKPILQRFKRVLTIEGNWSDRLDDELIDEDNRRYSQLAMMLRSRYLVDIDCWSESRGQPIKPGSVVDAALKKLAQPVATEV